MVGNYATADSLFLAAERIFLSHEVDEVLLANPLLGRALLYHRMGRLEDSEALFLQVLDIRTRQLGPESPYVAEVLREYGDLLRDLGRETEADDAVARAIDIEQVIAGPR